MRTSLRGAAWLLAGLLLGLPATASGQYFGQNKVQRQKFHFVVLQTEHFSIYYYPEELGAAQEMGRLAERWYARLAKIFDHQLTDKQILVLYSSHAEFVQTNVVEGEISEGVGGVTEGARRRIVLPMAATLADSNHVLGHELVHAFQYDTLNPRTAEYQPLWMIEGMAEYLSIGARDPQTAMWLRDAAYEDHLPALKNLDDPNYFPYRFGHAFWAYLTGRFGDSIIGKIMDEVALPQGGIDPVKAVENATGVDEKSLSEAWHKAIREMYDIAPGVTTRGGLTGSVLIDPSNERGQMNVSPAISPDGSRVAFLSARGHLSIDLYLADAVTGKVIKRLVSTASDPHFESLQFIASAGSWSPDGSQLAVATLQNGTAELAIFDGTSGKRLREVPFPDENEILQPAWSPDGKTIAFIGQAGGFTDLMIYSLETKQVRPLTHDHYGDLEPAWSPDGKRVVFVTERYSSDLSALSFGGLRLATVSIADGTIAEIPTGLSGNASSPQWSADGQSVYFVSDADGRPNIYRANVESGKADRVTAAAAGIMGITPTSAAVSMAAHRDRMAVTLFRNFGYEIHVIDTPAALISQGESGQDFALLPPETRASNIVQQQQDAPLEGLPAADTFKTEPKKTKLKLVSIGQSAGVSTSQFGTFFAGGVSFGFSDVLGEHIVGASIGLNGGIRDLGGSLSYLNRTSRWNWGTYFNRTPLTSGSAAEGFAVRNGQTVFVQQELIFRQTISEVGAVTAYPLNRVTRAEFSGGFQNIRFEQEIREATFDPFTGQQIGSDVQHSQVADALNLFSATGAMVRDTSTSGATGPVLGSRGRLEISQTGGDLRFTTVTADYRQYVMPFQPVTFAGRVLHIARYGSGSEDGRLVPMFLGYPTLVRGYEADSISASECSPTIDGSCPEFDRLFGSRILVLNGEMRAPALGLFTGQMKYGPVPVDIVGFFDAGIAWTSTTTPSFGAGGAGDRSWVSSAGVGARFNFFGIIGELDLVHPFQRPTRNLVWVFTFRTGF
jgi:hypothetical protein